MSGYDRDIVARELGHPLAGSRSQQIGQPDQPQLTSGRVPEGHDVEPAPDELLEIAAIAGGTAGGPRDDADGDERLWPLYPGGYRR